ncbi:hypothetical protein DICVIV_04023 [Dictyocaulus viviparus]|uniref:Uncharacterized protein n=1 Tax=Dictyocaulus viviparus TaxID=29172 RepID=A0A0D8Y1C5_DICVI|nr:hypothetical protein DICVIV_04023 [Dictyocaulus viviparus]
MEFFACRCTFILDNDDEAEVKQSNDVGVWLDAQPIIFDKNRSVCAPRALGDTSEILRILPSFEAHAKVKGVVAYQADHSEYTRAPYYYITYKILRPPVIISFKCRPLVRRMIEHPIVQRRARQKQENSYSGNFFTIINQKQQLSVAFSGSRRVNEEDHWNNGQDLQYSFQPLIIHNENQIEMVWAGPGGRVDQTLEIPRIVNVLLFNVLLGKPLVEAVTTPLFFPYGDVAYYTEGMSWVGANQLRKMTLLHQPGKSLQMLGKSSELFKMDTASAIEIRESGVLELVSFINFLLLDMVFLDVSGIFRPKRFGDHSERFMKN